MKIDGTVYDEKEDEYKEVMIEIHHGGTTKDDPVNVLEVTLNRDIRKGQRVYVSSKGLWAAVAKAIDY